MTKQFYGHMKSISKIVQQNELNEVKNSLYTSMLLKSQEKTLLPCTIGVVKEKGKEDSIDIGKMRYGSKYLEVVSEGL